MTSFGKRMDGPGGRRTAVREEVAVAASLWTTKVARTVVLLDVSATGARLCDCGPLKKGQDVWIKVPPVDAIATVMWCRGDECGVTFEHALSDDQVAHLCRQSKMVSMAKLSPDERVAAAHWMSGYAR